MTAERDERLPPRQALVHGVFVVVGWVLFFAAWWVVSRRPWDSYDLTVLIGVAAFAIPGVTYAWIRHNVAIYRRLGPRRAARAVEPRYERDFNGRRIEADWQALSRAHRVTIDAQGAVKRYRATGVDGVGAGKRHGATVDVEGSVKRHLATTDARGAETRHDATT